MAPLLQLVSFHYPPPHLPLYIIYLHLVSLVRADITVNIYHINVPPTIVSMIYETAGEAYNWTGSMNPIALTDNQCVVIGWEIEDPDSLLANLSSVVMTLPDNGTLYRYMPSGAGNYSSLHLSSPLIVSSSSSLCLLLLLI